LFKFFIFSLSLSMFLFIYLFIYRFISIFLIIIADNALTRWQVNCELSHSHTLVFRWLACLTDRISHLNASHCQTCESYSLIPAGYSEGKLHATTPNATRLIPLSSQNAGWWWLRRMILESTCFPLREIP